MQLRPLNDLDGASKQILFPIEQSPSVASVGPDLLNATTRLLIKERCEQLFGPIAVLDVGGEHHHHEKQANAVDQDVTLAPIDLLTSVEPPLVADFGALDRLAVNDRRAGLSLASLRQPGKFPQLLVDLLPQSVLLPAAEVVVNGRPRSEVRGKVAPLTSGLDHVEDRVDQFAEGMLARSSPFRCLGEEIIDESPLRIGEVGCVTHPQCLTGCGTKYKLSLQPSLRIFQTGS